MILKSICDQITPESWGEDNDMSLYRPDKLEKFLDKGGVLILA